MPRTILSLHKGNKNAIPFVQGKFNMGGSGVLDSAHLLGTLRLATQFLPELFLPIFRD
jgi:hypothetical protein